MHPAEELKKRTQAFAEDVMRLCAAAPSTVSRRLRKEASELLAIMAASHKTARENQRKRRKKSDGESRPVRR